MTIVRNVSFFTISSQSRSLVNDFSFYLLGQFCILIMVDRPVYVKHDLLLQTVYHKERADFSALPVSTNVFAKR